MVRMRVPRIVRARRTFKEKLLLKSQKENSDYVSVSQYLYHEICLAFGFRRNASKMLECWSVAVKISTDSEIFRYIFDGQKQHKMNAGLELFLSMIPFLITLCSTNV